MSQAVLDHLVGGLYRQFNYDTPLIEEYNIFNCHPSRFCRHVKRQNNL